MHTSYSSLDLGARYDQTQIEQTGNQKKSFFWNISDMIVSLRIWFSNIPSNKYLYFFDKSKSIGFVVPLITRIICIFDLCETNVRQMNNVCKLYINLSLYTL